MRRLLLILTLVSGVTILGLNGCGATLSVPVAPKVSMSPIGAVNEKTEVTVTVAIEGGAYDGAPHFYFEIGAGRLIGAHTVESYDGTWVSKQRWSTPEVDEDLVYGIACTVTVRGYGDRHSAGGTAEMSVHQNVTILAFDE